MPRTIYSLLIAIEDYPSPILKIRGCVNDYRNPRNLPLGMHRRGKGRRIETEDAT
jgi:hypothetical protein